MDTGNAAAVQLTPEQQYRSLLRPEVQPYYDRFLLQGGDYKKFDDGAALEQFNRQRTADQTFAAQQPEPEVTTTPEPSLTEKTESDLVKALTEQIKNKPTLADINQIMRDNAEYTQKLAKDSARTAFQYEMMGRIPDTIMAGLAGSGQLMREGARDISNTVMRGVEALPTPNIQARSYQNPTFRYFGNR
tara:strand:- start:1582 stop:2148 length:567 start_codon:yes stop_codon:yes gene_type:complete